MKLFLCLSVCLILTTCSHQKEYNISDESSSDFQEIKKRQRLVAIIEQNSTDYYIYKGEPRGFQFEMLQQLGQFLGMEVEVIVSNNFDEDFEALYKGKADIIAKSLTPSQFNGEIVSYSVPLYGTKHVLVQRKAAFDNKHVIVNKEDLVGQNIYIPFRSNFSKTLDSLKLDGYAKFNYFEMP
jgi:membrane-bound lytic murein transglycosylase F